MNKKAFTLVELIVVITILAILGTIGFISFQGYNVKARDSLRMSDLTTISKTLELFKTIEGYYSDPTNPYDVTYSGSLAWKQGIFGERTRQEIGRISNIPVDPLTNNEYSYSVTNSRQEYELGAMTEGITSSILGSEITSNADNSYYSYVIGNYNKEIVTVRDQQKLYILGVPTIITTEVEDVTIQDIVSNQSFSIQGGKNLPGGYIDALPNNQTHSGSTSFTPGYNPPVPGLLFDGNISDLNEDFNKGVFGENLFSYYNDSNLNHSIVGNMPTTDILNHVNDLIVTNAGNLPGDEITVNLNQNVPYYPTYSFVSTWDSQGTNNLTIIIDESTSGFEISYENIDDSSLSGVVTGGNGSTVVSLPIPGEYIVEITGDFPGMFFNGDAEAQKITSIIQWGNLDRGSDMSNSYYGATNLVSLPNNTRGLEGIRNMSQIFRGANLLSADLSNWDVSGVVNMHRMFYGTELDSDLSSWDVSNVENMSEMFRELYVYNGDLSNWNVSSVTNMQRMFWNAREFNSDISGWNVSGTQNMREMFRNAREFNSDISGWNVSAVTNMNRMFNDARSFDIDISTWNVSNVQSMSSMFSNAHDFNSDLSGWDVTLVTDVLNNGDFDDGSSGIEPGNFPIW